MFAVKGTWCSGITSASHAEGPGFKSQCVHLSRSLAPVRVDATAMPARWCALLRLLPDVGVQLLATCNASVTPEGWASPKDHLPREKLM